MTRRSAPGPIARLVAAAVLAAALSACGSTAAGLPTAAAPLSPAAASAGAQTTGPAASQASATSPAASPQTGSTDPAVAWPAFAACLRAHGLQVPDPVLDSQGQPNFGSLDLKSMITPAIATDCQPIVAGFRATKGLTNYSFQSLVAHAACLRQHGLSNYPDPDPNASEQHLAPGFDKSDPTVNRALVACHALLVEVSASASPQP